MRKLKNIICEIVILTLLSSTVFGMTSLNAMTLNTKNVDTEVKTSINDLLNADDYLFLDTEKPFIDSAISYLINADTGQVLYNDDGDFSFPILSVTKALSGFVVLDEMKKNPDKYNWDTRIKAEGSVVLVSYESNFSNLALYEGSEYTLRELFEGMMINSANAATMLIGKYMFGGEKEFVAQIRKKAEELHLSHTVINSSTGLNRNDLLEYGYELDEGDNKMSAEDVAFMTKNLIEEYPIVLEITAKSKSVFATLTDAPFEYSATNWLLPGFEYGYDGVDGLKTGADLVDYTSNVVFTAKKDGVRLIGVILGAKNSDVRSEGALALLDYGYKSLTHKTFINSDSKLFGDGTVKMKYASKDKLAVRATNDLILSTSYSDLQPEYTFVATNSKYNKEFDAFEGEIKKGEVLGYVTVKFADLEFLTNTNQTQYYVEVVANEDIGNGFFIFNGVEWIFDSLKRSFA